jgi:hypothetical protein
LYGVGEMWDEDGPPCLDSEECDERDVSDVTVEYGLDASCEVDGLGEVGCNEVEGVGTAVVGAPSWTL